MNDQPQFLLINKPIGWTSFDAVNFLRKKIIREIASPPRAGRNDRIRVGHAGTLDPFATGLLIVGVGREATKKLDEFKKLPKTYVANVQLGATSTTDDPTGVITSYVIPSEPQRGDEESLSVIPTERSERRDPSASLGMTIDNKPTIGQIEQILKTFLGPQLQTPPIYSAKKINGKRAYKFARAGQTVELQPVPIEIYDIKLLDYNYPLLKIEVTCSAGTYIRTIAKDIGEKLNTGAYCAELTRTAIGSYFLKDAQELAKNLDN